MITRNQIIRLQKIIVQLHNRFVNWEAIESTSFIWQRIYPSCLKAFKGIASTFRCRPRGLEGFESIELGECEGDLRWCVDGG